MSLRAEFLKGQIINCYEDMFGKTERHKRLDDIAEETYELVRYTDEANLKEELSDLICTCFALAAENNWAIDELVTMNLQKLKKRKENGHYEKTGELKSND